MLSKLDKIIVDKALKNLKKLPVGESLDLYWGLSHNNQPARHPWDNVKVYSKHGACTRAICEAINRHYKITFNSRRGWNNFEYYAHWLTVGFERIL